MLYYMYRLGIIGHLRSTMIEPDVQIMLQELRSGALFFIFNEKKQHLRNFHHQITILLSEG